MAVAVEQQTAQRTLPAWLAVGVPAVAMSLGWGLRGQFGGPRGAMVPGALVAIALALVSRRAYSAAEVWRIAAAGALGFAIGGEETYAQTIGLTRHTDLAAPYWNSLVAWGYLGLLVKGALWGGFGGLFLGVALGRRRYTVEQMLIAVNVALALSLLGYWYINVPKLIYFSGHAASKPRPEAWAGLWIAWLVLVAFAARVCDRTTVRMSLWGALGCALGFSCAEFAHAMGDRFLMASTGWLIDWWKVMECGFGLIGGAVLGLGWRHIQRDSGTEGQGDISPTVPLSPCPTVAFAFLTLDLLLLFYVADAVDGIGGWVGKVPFLFLAPALFIAADRSSMLQLALGMAMPIVLMFWNTQHYWVAERHLFGVSSSVGVMVLLSVAAAEAVRRAASRPLALFLLLAWVEVCIAWFKMLIPAPGSWGQPILVQSIFTVMAILLTLAMRAQGCRAPSANPAAE